MEPRARRIALLSLVALLPLLRAAAVRKPFPEEPQKLDPRNEPPEGWVTTPEHRGGVSEDKDGHNSCMAGYEMMEFYLLGYDKCGTTSMSTTLTSAGLETAAAGTRCNVKDDCFGCTQVNNNLCDKEIWAFGSSCDKYPGCPESLGSSELQDWADAAQFKYKCEYSPSNVTLADFSTLNIQYRGLPTLLGSMYPKEGKHLSLAAMVRDPMRRMQSHFYYNRPNGVDDDTSFGEWCNTTLKKALAQYPTYQDVLNAGDSLYWNDDLSHWYHSMYSLTMDEWLGPRGYFKPTQMAVLPMGWALDDQYRSVSMLQQQFPKTHLNADLVSGPAPSENSGSDHPALEDDIDQKTCEWLTSTYFRPDLVRLSKFLADGVEQGLAVGGFDEAVEHGFGRWPGAGKRTIDKLHPQSASNVSVAKMLEYLYVGIGEESCSGDDYWHKRHKNRLAQEESARRFRVMSLKAQARKARKDR